MCKRAQWVQHIQSTVQCRYVHSLFHVVGFESRVYRKERERTKDE